MCSIHPWEWWRQACWLLVVLCATATDTATAATAVAGDVDVVYTNVADEIWALSHWKCIQMIDVTISDNGNCYKDNNYNTNNDNNNNSNTNTCTI